MDFIVAGTGLSKRVKGAMFVVVLQSITLIIASAIYLMTFGPLVATGMIAGITGFLGLFIALAIYYISQRLNRMESRIDINKERDNRCSD